MNATYHTRVVTKLKKTIENLEANAGTGKDGNTKGLEKEIDGLRADQADLEESLTKANGTITKLEERIARLNDELAADSN